MLTRYYGNHQQRKTHNAVVVFLIIKRVHTMSNATTNNNAKTQASKTVALNDTRSTLVTLIAERENWETTLLRKSNDALYQILAQCYELYENMRGGENSIQRKKALLAVCEENNYRFVSSTPLITKIVKCVFGVERRRVSAYSIVLRTAIKQEISVAELAQWIEDMGGVEQVRLSKSPNAKTAKQKAELGRAAIEKSKAIATAQSELLGQKADADKAGEQCVLLAVQNADGSFSINAVINNQAATNAALVAYFSQRKKEAKENKEKEDATRSAKECEEAVTEALAA
jgi:hypothetical protein